MRRHSSILKLISLATIGALLSWRPVFAGVNYQGVNYQGVNYQGVNYQGVNYQGVNYQGVNYQGVNYQGVNYQGVNYQGVNYQGVNYQGVNYQGVNYQGVNYQGVNYQGVNYQGVNYQGVNYQGVNYQGVNYQGVNYQGVNYQGVNYQGVNYQGGGIDRPWGLLTPVQVRGIALANFTVSGLSQGLQSGAAISAAQVSSPMANVQLQFGPGSSTVDTGPGSYISVPTLPPTVGALKGSFWNMVLADGCTSGSGCPSTAACVGNACIEACTTDADCHVSGAKCVQGSCSDIEGGIALYIADVEVDSQRNSSNYPLNDDIYLYTVYYQQPATGAWASLCPVDAGTGRPTAMAVPLNPFDHGPTGRTNFTFACTASGVAAKCARNWGYKPWMSKDIQLHNATAASSIWFAPFYDACLVAARADYCQDDHSYTKNGTLVDLFDTLDGYTSINSTAGLPYTPYSTGVMLHEEYQVSALNVGTNPAEPHFVSENYTSGELASMPDQGALVSSLRMSGMESSRYADLDPGRSCAAGPYVDRCDPKEPFECYRSDLKTQALGAFLAVNSPRHCSHDEEHEGEALDPLCNECVNRVCQVDPTCCADPGGSFYPGSLVWDQRCTDIRNEVCRNDTDPSSPLWPVGTTAPPAGSHPVVFMRGAIGSFAGIVSEGGKNYAEGWACDPDHPGASVNVQISVGGPLGATDTSGTVISQLYTSTADGPLVPAWREGVATECGDGGTAPHGFRFPLPATAAGADIFIYGIDLDAPGAPFSLLRAGKKMAPPATATNPRAAIWTGWVAPPVTGNYQFQAAAGSTDKYRLWVNGTYVAGNWKDVDPNAAGAFELNPPTAAPSFYMLAGVRYSVRVEYLRTDTLPADSQFRLSWSSPDSPPAVAPGLVPASALYPIAQGSGNGLVGSYYLGTSLPATGPADGYSLGAVDYLWTTGQPPISATTGSAGIAVGQSFAARFEGQVMPPASGDYTFTADTDGQVRIFVNGQLVTGPSGVPDFAASGTCAHSVCSTGAAISKTCSQGFFCAGQICQSDPGCCAQTWDAICVKKVADICGLDCNPAPPIAVSLQAGVKYQIRVEYVHLGSSGTGPTEVVHGARLQLKWALPANLSDVIPQERLFAGATGAPAGVGLNAGYFVPDTNGNVFGTEYLDHVEGGIAFAAATPPAPTLASGIVCGADAGEPACSAPAAVAGGPAITSPPSGSTVYGLTTAVTGAGAIRDGSIAIYDCVVDAATGECARNPTSGVEDWSRQVGVGTAAASGVCDGLASPTEVCGAFTGSVTVMSKGVHWLAAAQGSTPSNGDGRIRLVFADAPNLSAPPAPGVSQPPAGFSSANGVVPVQGIAATGDTITVTATSGGRTHTFTFSAAAWAAGDTINLPPGDWSLTITQTDGAGNTSAAGAPLDVTVALPPLTLTSPDDNSSITGATALAGTGAVPLIDGTSLDVIISDGDGRFFPDRPDRHVPVQAGGTFSKTLAPSGNPTAGALLLDYGKHQIKAYQSVNGLDGAGAIRTVLVPPPRPAVTAVNSTSFAAGSPAVDITPADGAVVVPSVVIKGMGLLRNGAPDQSSLPVRANVYQGQTKLGQAVLDGTTGAFAIPVTIAGVGQQTLSITQVASSLSGAGDAESAAVNIVVVVRPPAPIIKTPATGAQLANAPFAVGGTAAPSADPNSTVTIVPDVGAPRTVTVGPDGSFATHPGTNPSDDARDLSISPGVHTLSAYQTVNGARGPSGNAVLVAVGDVTPPQVSAPATISVSCDGTTVVDASPGLSPAPACDAGGATVGYASLLTAQDDVTSLPATFAQCLTAGTCTCAPTSGSEMPFGSTAVSCSARDDAGNVGSTSFAVSVTSKTLPSLDATGLTAEAQGPSGAAVDYRVTASGFVANCGGPIDVVPCAQWQTAYQGLGFIPIAVGMDASDGTLYAHFYGDSVLTATVATNAPPTEQMLKSSDGGATWQALSLPGVLNSAQVVAAAGTVYIPSTGFGGIRISHDRGATWVGTALDGHSIFRIAVDPRNPAHMLATGIDLPGQAFETTDGWATWTSVGQGLPSGSGVGNSGGPVGSGMIAALAFDPVTPDRVYATVEAEPTDAIKTKIYRRIGAGPWQRLNVPTYADAVANVAVSVAVAPVVRSGQTFPRVFAGTVMSDDGGETWLDLPYFSTVENLVFSPADPNILYASTFGNMWRSADGGDTWSPTTQFATPMGGILIADLHDTQTIYASSGQDNILGIGIYKSTNGAATWTPLEAPGVTLAGARIKDLATDPVDANIAYLISDRGGVFKTTNGGGSWLASNNGVDDPFSLQDASKIAIDPLARNNVYVGRIGLWQSPDSGATWTNPGAAATSELSDFAIDPLARGVVFTAGSRQTLPSAKDFELVGGTLRAVNSLATFNSNFIESYHVQIAASPGRKVIKSWADQAAVRGGHSFFSLAAAEASTQAVATTDEYGTVDQVLYDNIVYDHSDGSDRVFAGGSMLNRLAGTHLTGALYSASLDSVSAAGGVPSANWQPLLPGGPTGFSTFSRLLIDPVSGGQIMYTLGTTNSLWRSDDGGKNWRQDTSVPAGMFVTNIWLSPADGALFATLAPAATDTSALYHTNGGAAWAPGLLWKRTAQALPPGARAVQGSLRPACTVVLPASVPADDPKRLRAVGPGATFPIDDDTTVECAVTDAFGNTKTKQFTIAVRDTTPPALTVPTQIAATIASGRTNVTVAFTGANAVSAADLVDGAVTPACTAVNGSTTIPITLAGTAFTGGAWTVTCTSADTRHNSASASFPVIVSSPGQPALAPPTLTTPGDQTANATSTTTGPVSFTVTASSGATGHPALTPTCSAPIGTGGATVTLTAVGSTFTGTFPIGTREVTCSVTDTAASPQLTVARSFAVTVKDAPPTITVPGDFSLVAINDLGRAVSFDSATSDAPGGAYPTATDTVDGSLVPLCSPASGSTFPIGVTTVICRATDSAGNLATGSFRVTITGHPPVLHLPTDPQIVHAQDQYGAAFNYDALVSASDASGALPISCAPLSGSFPLGDTTVSCRASNAQGDTEGSFIVRVVDLEAPSVTVPPTITLEAVGPDGSPVTFTRSSPPNAPTITVTALDDKGHTVVDAAGNPLSFVVSTFDVVSGSPTPTCRRANDSADLAAVNPGPPQFPLGDDVVTCSATDDAGNTGSASFTIVVHDTTAPALHLPGLPPVPPLSPVDADASGGATVNYDDGTNVYATDAVSGDPVNHKVPISCTPRSGSRFLVGSTTVGCVARDAAGNEKTGSFAVVVRDASHGKPCTSGTQCGSGQCVDGVCCDSACGGNVPDDCQACSVAAGSTEDGTCATLSAAHTCRPKASACDVAETCDGTSVLCPADAVAAAGTTCRDKNGDCDVAETCDGSSAACPADTLVSAGTICRDKAGDCDVAETCTGSSAACPADRLVPGGTICRDRTGDCDVAEVCTGSSAACPADHLVPAGTICRDKAGDCDVAETCTGSSTACPADSLVPPGTICRAKNGACDVAETCTGSSAACPPDILVLAGTICRDKNGDCDIAETCTGSSAACPPDILVLAGTICRDKSGDCDIAETCTGSSAACPADSLVPPGTICRDKNGDCDVAETCTGSSAACPADGLAALGTICRDKNGDCDVAETCTGSSRTCPTDGVAAPGTICRVKDGDCDVAETCDGSSRSCPTDGYAAAGTPCGSGSVCRAPASCSGGAPDCPASGIAPPTTKCFTSSPSNPCQVDEYCASDGTCPSPDVPPASCPAVPSGSPVSLNFGLPGGADPNPPTQSGWGITLTFTNVTTAGNISLVETDTGPTPLAGFEVLQFTSAALGPYAYWMFKTNAVYTGQTNLKIHICIHYDQTWLTSSANGAVDESNIHIEHWDANGVGMNISGSSMPDVANNKICGDVDSLSPFALIAPPAASVPTLTLPANMVVEAAGKTGTAVTYTAKATSPADGSITPVCTPASGSTFPIGTTTVNCTATDHNGVFKKGSFTVTVRDTKGPVFGNVPGPIVAYATCSSGATVTYTKPTATDAVDGNVAVSCSPASGSMFAPGQKTVTCTATDSHTNSSTATFSVWVKFQAPMDGTFFLQPINPDGSSIFRLGSTVPVKFQLTGASAGITNLAAKLTVAKVSSSVTGTYTEAVSTSSADSGSTFRYDATSKQYIFNLSTKSLATGTWSLKADLGDQVTHTVNISLK